MYEIIPSPGTDNKDFQEIEKKLDAVKPFARTIHIDVCDGIFAPNKTFADPRPFAKYAKDFIFEIHLMTENPVQYLKSWADAGFQRFIGQIEMMPDQVEFVAKAQAMGEVGLAIDGPTGIEKVKVAYDDLDVMLFYTGDRAGFSGKSLQVDRLKKVKAFREKMPYLPIEADGGINDETILIARDAGISRFVTTGFIFNSESTPSSQFQVLEEKLKTGILP